VEACKYLGGMPFSVVGEKVDGFGRLRIDQNLVESPDWPLVRASHQCPPMTPAGCSRPVPVERSNSAGAIEGHAPAGVRRRRTCHRVDLRIALLSKLFGQVGLWLDENATPAALLEVPSLRIRLRIVSADFNKEPGLFA